jgi:inner membrane transporter RhtA
LVDDIGAGAHQPAMFGKRALPLGTVVLAIVSVQTGAALAKHLFPVVGAQGAVTLRLTLAAAILLIIWRPWRRPLERRTAMVIVGFGLALGIMNLTFYLALRTIPLGVAVALEFLGPLTVAVLESRRPLDFVWIVLAAAGVLLLSPLNPTTAPLDPIGVGLALVAGVCWGLYIVFGQKAGGGDRGQVSSIAMTVAALVAAPWGVPAVAHHLSPAVLAGGLGVAILSSALPYSLELFAMSRLPARTFSIMMSLEPAMAALAGFLVLNERLAPWQLAAIAAVMAASAGSAATTPAVITEPAPN